MQTSTTNPSIPAVPAVTTHAGRTDARSAKILARSLYRDMKGYGVPHDKILAVASELIALVTDELDPSEAK